MYGTNLVRQKLFTIHSVLVSSRRSLRITISSSKTDLRSKFTTLTTKSKLTILLSTISWALWSSNCMMLSLVLTKLYKSLLLTTSFPMQRDKLKLLQKRYPNNLTRRYATLTLRPSFRSTQESTFSSYSRTEPLINMSLCTNPKLKVLQPTILLSGIKSR